MLPLGWLRMTVQKAIIIGGATMVAFLIGVVVNLAYGPVPPREKLEKATGVVDGVHQKTVGKGSRTPIDAFNLVVRQPSGHLIVVGIGGERQVSCQSRAFLVGKEVEILADPNRAFEIKVGGRIILPYEVALAYWQEDRRDQNNFLLFCLAIWLGSWAALGTWYWSKFRTYRSADGTRSGALDHAVDSWRALPYKRAIVYIIAYVVAGFSFLALLGYLSGVFEGLRCPDYLGIAVLGAFFLWIAFSILLLLRNVPLERPLPYPLAKAWGPLDWTVILAIAVCLAVLIAKRHECI